MNVMTDVERNLHGAGESERVLFCETWNGGMTTLFGDLGWVGWVWDHVDASMA